ncbi:unnamed protein product [Ilex paraguariensis]|uniref:CCT domain-containing protein n=1 Tax=Ilex paraguariensis TaxID=185542 RepID=A0ABC8SYI8_9AQUA
MSSCLSGGGRAYGLEIEIVKSPTTSWNSHSSSPSSTLSETSNSPLAISSRKPRTPRKRPNQNYNEAAALLSTAYPKIFSTKHLTKPGKFTKPQYTFSYESSELLLPFQVVDNSGFSLHQSILEKPNFRIEPKVVNSCEKPCQSPGEIEFQGNSLDLCDDYQEDFDAESILDEEIEEGMDSIMGNLSVDNDLVNESNAASYGGQINTCYGYPMGFGFGPKLDLNFGVRKNKKKKKVEKGVESAKGNSIPRGGSSKVNSIPKPPKEEDSIPKPNSGLLLKLNYDDVLTAWSDSKLPFSDEVPGNDLHARLAQIDLFSESGGVREASVMRYKEKRRTRLFSKKIRYQVRKVNADQRPRVKGRFVRRANSPESDQR